MTENNGNLAPVNPDGRLEYEPPTLTVLGTVEDITKADQNTGQDDAGGAGLKTGDGG
jgi:hypothetical protein